MTTLYHASDLHFGIADEQALRRFAEAVEDERPDGVVITGDITQRARHSEFSAAADYLSALAAPVFVQPGNHDMPYFNLAERFTRPYRRMRRVERAARKRKHWPGCTIVELNTTARAQAATNWSQGVVRRQVLDNALNALEKVASGDVALVASHHPLFDVTLTPPEDTNTGITSYKESRTRGGMAALNQLAAAGAAAFLSGHVHEPFHQERTAEGRSVHLIGSGTLSTRIRAHPASFNVITVAGGEVSVHHRRA